MKKTSFLYAIPVLFMASIAYADTQTFSPSAQNSFSIMTVFPTLSGQSGEAFNMVLSGSYYRGGYHYPIDTLNVTKYPGEDYLWGITSTGTVNSVTIKLTNIQHRNSSADNYTASSITDKSCQNMVFSVGTKDVGWIDVKYNGSTDTYTCTIRQ